MQNAYQKRGMLVVDAEIPAYSVEVVDFFDLKPNYFRVQNKGATKVFCGISKVPTDESYDFFCKGESFSMYAEPHASGYLNIYNPSGTPVKVRVLGFAAPFDPLALAFSQIEFDFSDMKLETVGAISEFKASLPAGSNVIGKVSVNGSIPAGSNKIGKVDVSSLPATAPTLAKQNEIVSAVNDTYKQNYVDHVGAFNLVDNQGEQAISNGGFTLIHMLTNDGDTDFSLVLGDQSIPIKPGESITDLKFYGTVKLYGETYSARMLVSYP